MARTRLLLIDDDEATEPIVRAAFGDGMFQDIACIRVYDAALAAILEQRYDACLLSSHIQERSTIELLRRAVSEGCRTPVIVLTRDGAAACDDAAMRAGAADAIAKNPLNPDLLNRTVRHAVERSHWQEKREHSAAKLAQANAELQRFAYVASHDLQEPLRAMARCLRMIQQRYADALDEAGRQFIDQALQSAERMRQLILDLLAYSRVGASEKPPTLTHSTLVLRGVLDNLQAQVEESAAVVTHDDLPEVLIDATQLSQLLQNLVSNAIKFVKGRPPRVHISAEPHEEGWLFCVRDNGIGIEAAMSERVFEVFRRLHSHEQYPGSGIGLAVCKHIVERHGGRIWVESQPGEGSAFYFTLPASRQGKEGSHAQIAA